MHSIRYFSMKQGKPAVCFSKWISTWNKLRRYHHISRKFSFQKKTPKVSVKTWKVHMEEKEKTRRFQINVPRFDT